MMGKVGVDFLVQSVEKQPQCELMYGNKFCERSCDAYSLNRKLICFCPKAWEKDCSDYESDKLNTTDVELETTQPVRTLRVFPCAGDGAQDPLKNAPTHRGICFCLTTRSCSSLSQMAPCLAAMLEWELGIAW